MTPDAPQSRRGFIAMAGAGLILSTASRDALAASKAKSKESKVGPVEDLMREHGLLRRVFLIYDEVLRRLGDGRETPPEVVAGSAEIVRHFVEDYHEKLEEDELFPRFEKAGKLTELVKVLYDQHQAGRRLTEAVIASASAAASTDEESRHRLADALGQFTRMYRPHAAREDTVLFPALRSIVSPREYAALGEKFEDKEEKLFGKDGFEKMVDKVAALEKSLGIYELAQFTPKP